MNRETKIAIFIFFIAAVLSSAFAGYIYYQYTVSSKEMQPMSGTILWHGNRQIPEIALTFDDGPNSKATPRILDILKENDVKATFFVLGKFIEKNKDILKRESEEGHLIGNHTFTHANGKITDIAKINRELVKTDKLITQYTGKSVNSFRPPFGFENWRFLTEAEFLDDTIVLWSLDVGDWNDHKAAKDIASKVLKLAKNGSIILLHDGGASREAVIDSLPVIIKGLKKKGYNFVTIDEMIEHLKN